MVFAEVPVELRKAGWEQVVVAYWQFLPQLLLAPLRHLRLGRAYPTLHRLLEDVHLQGLTLQLAVDTATIVGQIVSHDLAAPGR